MGLCESYGDYAGQRQGNLEHDRCLPGHRPGRLQKAVRHRRRRRGDRHRRGRGHYPARDTDGSETTPNAIYGDALMAINAVRLAGAIADLVVTGLTIRDLDNVPQAITARDCPMIYPVPEKFLFLEEAQQLTFGPTALWAYTYAINYRYVFGPVGNERNQSKTLPSAVTGYVNFIKVVSRNAQLLKNLHVKPGDTPEWGVLTDSSGQQFQAADLLLRVVEYSAD